MARELLTRGKARRSKHDVRLERDEEGIFHVVIRGPGKFNKYRDHDFPLADEADALEVYGNFIEDRELTPEEEARWNDVFIVAAARMEQMSDSTPQPPGVEIVEQWAASDGHRVAMLVKHWFSGDEFWWGVDVAHRNHLGILVWHQDERRIPESAARDEFRMIIGARI